MSQVTYKDTEIYLDGVQSPLDEADAIGDEDMVIGDENDSVLVLFKLLFGKPLQQIRNTTSKVARVVRRQDL